MGLGSPPPTPGVWRRHRTYRIHAVRERFYGSSMLAHTRAVEKIHTTGNQAPSGDDRSVLMLPVLGVLLPGPVIRTRTSPLACLRLGSTFGSVSNSTVAELSFPRRGLISTSSAPRIPLESPHMNAVGHKTSGNRDPRVGLVRLIPSPIDIRRIASRKGSSTTHISEKQALIQTFYILHYFNQ